MPDKLVRDKIGEEEKLNMAGRKVHINLLLEEVISDLKKARDSKDKIIKYELVADSVEKFNMAISLILPKNPAAYDEVRKIAKEQALDGGYFKGYYKETHE